MRTAFLVFGFGLVLLTGCDGAQESTPTTGVCRVVVDETLYPIADALVRAFEHTYPNAKLDISYLPEVRAFTAFEKDSIQVILSARELGQTETAFFKNNQLNPRTAIFANDAIALLVNPANPDTNLTCQQALDIFNGKIVDWSAVNPSNHFGDINLVFDHQASSTVRFVMEKSGAKSLPTNSFAQKTTEAVVDYVQTHKGALGIVGYSWLSDYDDPLCRKLRSQVKVIAISPCGNAEPQAFFKPYADNIGAGDYPFSRQLFLINRETSMGLGTGFTAFVAGELGQRIISKTGILPAYRVEHNIELKSEQFRVKK